MRLLSESLVFGRKRYAVLEGKAFCAQEHEPGRWHGYPIGWEEVPHSLRKTWLEEGKVTRRDMKAT
jgi:hypothetical protein